MNRGTTTVLALTLVALLLPVAAFAQDHDGDLERYGKKLKEAVAAGVLTPEEARAKWNAAEKKAHQGSDLEAYAKKLEQAVADGVLTPEEARAKMNAAEKKAALAKEERAKKERAKKEKGDAGSELEAYARKLKQAVAEGVLSEAEARAKWNAAEKKVAEKKAAAKRAEANKADAKRAGAKGDGLDARLDRLERRVERLTHLLEEVLEALRARPAR